MQNDDCQDDLEIPDFLKRPRSTEVYVEPRPKDDWIKRMMKRSAANEKITAKKTARKLERKQKRDAAKERKQLKLEARVNIVNLLRSKQAPLTLGQIRKSMRTPDTYIKSALRRLRKEQIVVANGAWYSIT